jgi:uncharacterized protein (TIGR02611 family)
VDALYKTVRKVLIGVIGGTVVLLGIVMIVTPGPGLAAIIAGLAILASEFVFAAVLLRRIKSQARGMAQRVGLARKESVPAREQPTSNVDLERSCKVSNGDRDDVGGRGH